MGAPIGNDNPRRGRIWRDAILRAIEKRSRVDQREALDALAEKLLAKCDEGDLQALKEFGDRMDGKPSQNVALTGDDGGPVQFKGLDWNIVGSPKG